MAMPFEAVHAESEQESKASLPSSRGWVKKLCWEHCASGSLRSWPCQGQRSVSPWIWVPSRAPSSLGLDAQMSLKASALKSVKKRKLAEKIVLKAMRKTRRKYADHFEQKQACALPAGPADASREMLTKEEIIPYRASKKAKRAREATHAYCAFNVLEAFVSAVALGDDINAIIRVCPPPRDGESELACQVEAAILVTWVGNAAARLAYAASNCATTLNVNAVCAVGVTGLVAVLGELAATASLAAATCTGVPPQLTTSKISLLGEADRARRLATTTARWRGSDWRWRAVWGERRYGGCQHCQHGDFHQLCSEQRLLRPREPPGTHQQGHWSL